MPPPNIQKQILEQLLHIYTSETPFMHNGQVYKQISGVSMLSPLGPTFADFYMPCVENSLPLFQGEIVRLKQLFCNNNYPQHLVESIIQSSVTNFLDPQQDKRSSDIKFFVQLTNLQTFNADYVSLKNIVKKHVSSLNPDKQINLLTYIKPRKLSSLFSIRRRCEDTAEVRVVYKFCCTEEDISLPILGT